MQVTASPVDDRFLSIGEADGDVRLWSMDGTLLKTLAGVPGIHAIDWSSNGLIAAGEDDGLVALYRADGNSAGSLTGHDGFVNSIHFQPQGDLIASGDNRGRDLSGGPMARLSASLAAGEQDHWSYVRWSPAATAWRPAVHLNASRVQLWDASGKQHAETAASIEGLAWQPDEPALYLRGSMYVSHKQYRWDLKDAPGELGKVRSTPCTVRGLRHGRRSKLSWRWVPDVVLVCDADLHEQRRMGPVNGDVQ